VNQSFSLTIEPFERLYVECKTPEGKALADFVEIFANIRKVEHG
jgi:hypothetical protein